VNWIDLLLIVLVGVSLVRGLRLGAAVQVMSFGGFWLGLVLGALLAPPIARLAHTAAAKAILSLVVVFGVASLLGTVGRQVGVRIWRLFRQIHLGPADSGIGAVVAGVATLLAAWIVASMLSSAPVPRLSAQINGSAILRGLDGVLPSAPTVFSRIQQLLNAHGFPQVFAQLSPQSAGPVALPSQPTLRAAALAGRHSTFKIEAEGCGELLEGSGFLVAPDVVLTNAHVIAGTGRITVIDGDGNDGTPARYPATPIFFDPNLDIALLRTSSPPPEPVLSLDGSNVNRGAQGAVLGYPGGNPFDVEAAAVQAQFQAVGRDIYGGGLTQRSVYQIQSLVRAGNSGGPLIEADGAVVGVVFSRSASDPNVGYALASPPVLAKVRANEASTTPVGTGDCTD